MNANGTKPLYAGEIAELLRPVMICCWHRMLLTSCQLWALSKLQSDDQIEQFCAKHLDEGFRLSHAIANGCRLEQNYRHAGMTLITACDALYPPMLKKSAQVSPVLAVKGDCSILSKPQVAVVGSRETHALTPQTVSYIANALHARDQIITSGGARGTDALAHREAMKANRATVVVAGTGADVVFPAENRDIFEYAAGNGAIVSPFPSGVQGLTFNFPTRNAIIAGLSQAVVVVQCRVRSGALYTAKYAIRMGRPVLVPCMPGFSALTEGSLELARSGKAQWFTSVEDLHRILGDAPSHPQLDLPLADSACASQPNRKSAEIAEDLTMLGAAIVKVLRGSPQTRECLRQKVVESGVDSVDFDETLLDLELAGTIAQCAGQYAIAAG